MTCPPSTKQFKGLLSTVHCVCVCQYSLQGTLVKKMSSKLLYSLQDIILLKGVKITLFTFSVKSHKNALFPTPTVYKFLLKGVKNDLFPTGFFFV